jgi:hypothetical protein
MKYIPLSSLQNKYPSILNYRNESNSVSIKGIYEDNELNIPATDFSQIGVVPNTKFRFVIRLFNSEGSNQILNTFTSEGYFNDLVRAKRNSNPYFINTALNPDTFVKLYLNKIKETFDTRISVERQYGVSVNFNNLFDSDGSIDYLRFGQYIDWVVSQPNLDDIVGNGVLPSRQISSFNVSEFTTPNIDIEIPTTPRTGGGTPTGGGGSTGGGTPTGGGGSTGGGTPTGGGGSVGTPTPGGGNASIGGSGAGIGEGRQEIITIDGNEFEINILPDGLVGGSPVGGEGERGNPTPGQGTSRGGGNFFNPEDGISDEYEYRDRNMEREL